MIELEMRTYISRVRGVRMLRANDKENKKE